MLSEKKTCANFSKFRISKSYIIESVGKFKDCFQAHRHNNLESAINYVSGLFKCSKGEANIERMDEELGKEEYRVYQQFISNSTWDFTKLLNRVAVECSDLLQKQKKKNKLPVGYIIDESAHLKKGKESVGVARQYAGVIGKVDNCQVGVYSSLVNDKYAGIINERIFLPEKWIQDKKRLDKTGVPEDSKVFKTKPELALNMITQDIERGIEFDWIGGDGLYGHSFELCQGIENLGKLFVLDVHKDEKVFLSEPVFKVPEKRKGKGRNPKRLKADIEPVRLDKLLQNISEDQWKLEEIRPTTTGILYLNIYKKEVWIWNGKDSQATKRTLIITKTTGVNPKVKYSFSNGNLKQYTHKEYGYFVAQRYWVERTFDDAKNELGMSDFQVRKWKGWHHHHSLVMLASLLIMKQMLNLHPDVPLLSFRDARILVIIHTFGTQKELNQRIKQMLHRHKKREYDMKHKLKKQNISEILKS